MDNSRSQRGQVLLIVVLIMVIALTVGLALASRSIINLKNSSEESDSQKAFQAAEAGVDIALQKQQGTTDVTIAQKTLDNNSVINSVVIHPLAGTSILLNNGEPLIQDNGMDVWLTTYPDYSGNPWTGKINIFWGTKSGCQDAAIEAIVISGASSIDPNATINRYGIDPCGTTSIDPSQNRTGQNKFGPASAGGTVGNKTFNFSTSISITNGIILRIIPLYTNTPIGIKGYDNSNNPKNMPAQGRVITSTGSYGSTTREVSFFQGYPQLPSVFFYSIFQPK